MHDEHIFLVYLDEQDASEKNFWWKWKCEVSFLQFHKILSDSKILQASYNGLNQGPKVERWTLSNDIGAFRENISKA